MNAAQIKALQEIAALYRERNADHQHRYRTGVVLIHAGTAYGWKDTLRNPDHEIPGNFAVDAEGRVYRACDGNDYDGAERWEAVTKGGAA